MEDICTMEALNTLIKFNVGRRFDKKLIDACIGLIECNNDIFKNIEINGKSYGFTEINSIITSAINKRNE